jgi:hypothetical protein
MLVRQHLKILTVKVYVWLGADKISGIAKQDIVHQEGIVLPFTSPRTCMKLEVVQSAVRSSIYNRVLSAAQLGKARRKERSSSNGTRGQRAFKWGVEAVCGVLRVLGGCS